MKDIDKIELSSSEKLAVQEATGMLKNKFSIKKIILFGSKARGDSDKESDIDLLLLTEGHIHWKERQKLIHELFDLGMEYDVIFSILDIPEEEFYQGMFSSLPIYDEVIKDGADVL